MRKLYDNQKANIVSFDTEVAPYPTYDFENTYDSPREARMNSIFKVKDVIYVQHGNSFKRAA